MTVVFFPDFFRISHSEGAALVCRAAARHHAKICSAFLAVSQIEKPAQLPALAFGRAGR